MSSKDRMIDEMEEEVAELRREILEALALERDLESRTAASESVANDLEFRALQAVERNDKKLARRILEERVEALKHWAAVSEKLRQSCRRTRRLKADLVRMENRNDRSLPQRSGALNLRTLVEGLEADLTPNA